MAPHRPKRPCFVDLPLPRVFEFLTVTEICRAEELCSVLRIRDTPLVFEKVAHRSVPKDERTGGPSATLIPKDRVRRWTIATRLVDHLERQENQTQELLLNIDPRTFWYSDFFVRLTKVTSSSSTGQARTTLAQGFVPYVEHNGDSPLLQLSLNPLLQTTIPEWTLMFNRLNNEMDSIAEHNNRMPGVDDEQNDALFDHRLRQQRERALQPVFANLLLTVLQVDRKGTCSPILTTQAQLLSAARFGFSASHTIPNGFCWHAFKLGPVVLLRDEGLARTNLYTRLNASVCQARQQPVPDD